MNGFLFDILQASCLYKPWYESDESIKEKRKIQNLKVKKKKKTYVFPIKGD